MDSSSAILFPNDAGVAVGALALGFAFVVYDGMRKLSGGSSTSLQGRIVKREPGQSVDEWLLGASQKRLCKFDVGGLAVNCGHSSASVQCWQADRPPPLRINGFSHFWGFLGKRLTSWILPDIVIRPDPVVINANVETVWQVLTDFEAYTSWNPFHRSVSVVHQNGGSNRAVRMTVDLGPIMGKIVSEETIYYCDSKRKIFIYGAWDAAPSCFRCVYLTKISDQKTLFSSYDMIGGYPALLSRGHIVRCVFRGFSAQHRSMKRVCERKDFLCKQPSRKLGVCLITGGSGFLGSHLARQLASLPKSIVQCVHLVDVKQPRRERLKCLFHLASITDGAAMEALFEQVRPDTVFHVASKIDLRPFADLEAVNVDATDFLLRLAKRHGTSRFIYTSSIEVVGVYNTVCSATENAPYPAHPTNNYQKSKIDAESLVRDADAASSMRALAIRPGHIFGDRRDDPLDLSGVPIAFSENTFGKPALMSMVHVENCALAHIISACLAESLGGRVINVSDFDMNIVSTYRKLCGMSDPPIVLPYFLLSIFVNIAVVLHAVLETITGLKLLGPMIGLNDGAKSAGLTYTIDATFARERMGYVPIVSLHSAAMHHANGNEGAVMGDVEQRLEDAIGRVSSFWQP